MVVRDLLGRETVVEQPFFSLPTQPCGTLAVLSLRWVATQQLWFRLERLRLTVPGRIVAMGLSNFVTIEGRAEVQKGRARDRGASAPLPLGGKQAVTSGDEPQRRQDGRRGQTSPTSMPTLGSISAFRASGEAPTTKSSAVAADASASVDARSPTFGMRLGDYGCSALFMVPWRTGLGVATRYASASHSLAISPEWRFSMAYNRSSGVNAAQKRLHWPELAGPHGVVFAGTTARRNATWSAPVARDMTVRSPQALPGNYESFFNWNVAANRTRGRAEAEWLTSMWP